MYLFSAATYMPFSNAKKRKSRTRTTSFFYKRFTMFSPYILSDTWIGSRENISANKEHFLKKQSLNITSLFTHRKRTLVNDIKLSLKADCSASLTAYPSTLIWIPKHYFPSCKEEIQLPDQWMTTFSLHSVIRRSDCHQQERGKSAGSVLAWRTQPLSFGADGSSSFTHNQNNYLPSLCLPFVKWDCTKIHYMPTNNVEGKCK